LGKFLESKWFFPDQQYNETALNVSPSFDSPMTETQGFIALDRCEINESVSIALQNPMVKKPNCIFSSRKSLEQVVDELKGKVSPILANEPN
jgi:hypothetical protein